MGLSQALSIGISGLVTHQRALDNVGNNLANVNTVGFKKGVFQFRTLLEQTFRGGMSADPQTGRGSINPISLGLGTQTGSVNKVFTQGPFENTANPNDMAIEGNGFFVLSQGNGYVYSRDGSFYLGADGSLMGGNGLFVQGTMAVKDSKGGISIPQDAKLQNIIIPLGETGGMVQTSQVEFKGNLNSKQKVSEGLRLFGGTSYPTQGNLQQWMWKDCNGGDPTGSSSKVDTSWNALEEKTYVVSEEMLQWARENYGVSMNDGVAFPKTVTSYTSHASMTHAAETRAQYAVNTATGQVVAVSSFLPADPDFGDLHTVDDILKFADPVDGSHYIPIVEDVKTINGGNVQTSAAYAIEVPSCLSPGSTYTDPSGRKYTIGADNKATYPQWFYESTGAITGDVTYADIVDWMNGLPPDKDPNYATELDAVLARIWPNGINNDNTMMVTHQNMPRQGETFAASLTTPLENLQYQKGNTWVKPFANIKNGDEITINFKKGQAQIEATFVYNRPGPAPLSPPQQALNIEKSYTLEDFMKFLGGDVDEPSIACERITPAMYGAKPDAEYPDGNPNRSDLVQRNAHGI